MEIFINRVSVKKYKDMLIVHAIICVFFGMEIIYDRTDKCIQDVSRKV